ncbi:MAG: hypothetical protein ACK5KU_00060 [Beutenbergiaceae bacterium]
MGFDFVPGETGASPVTGPRLTEPRLGIVAVMSAISWVLLGLVLAAVIATLVVIALAMTSAIGEAPRLEDTGRLMAGAVVVVGTPAGLLALLALTVSSVASLPRYQRLLAADPHAVPSKVGLRQGGPVLGMLWSLPLVLVAFIMVFVMLADPSLGALGVLLMCIALIWLAFRDSSRKARRQERWTAVTAELARRTTLAVRADDQRRQALPQGQGPSTLAWRTSRRVMVLLQVWYRASIGGAVLGCIIGIAMARAYEDYSGPVTAAAIPGLLIALGPILVPLMLGWATVSMVIGERAMVRWARQHRERVPHYQPIAAALTGMRASRLGSMTLAIIAGLCLIVTMTTTPDQPFGYVPIVTGVNLLPVALINLGAAVVWALLDIPIARRDREQIRAACSPGSLVMPDPQSEPQTEDPAAP